MWYLLVSSGKIRKAQNVQIFHAELLQMSKHRPSATLLKLKFSNTLVLSKIDLKYYTRAKNKREKHNAIIHYHVRAIYKFFGCLFTRCLFS